MHSHGSVWNFDHRQCAEGSSGCCPSTVGPASYGIPNRSSNYFEARPSADFDAAGANRFPDALLFPNLDRPYLSGLNGIDHEITASIGTGEFRPAVRDHANVRSDHRHVLHLHRLGKHLPQRDAYHGYLVDESSGSSHSSGVPSKFGCD